MAFAFGDHVLDIERRELRRGGDWVALEPQVFDLLVYLVRNRDRVVSKDDLIASVWGGRIVSDSAVTTRLNAARKAVGDSGLTQALIRTVHRKGVRFVAEVREEKEPPTPEPAPAAVRAEPVQPGLIPPDKPSIAVLPFANMSSDPEQEFFGDGVAEDIITALSRYPSLFVIARNSCFTYKGRAVDVTQVGRDLGVRYVLEGSLRKSGDRLRVTAQLVEAETGAERYDRDLADIFTVQDEITTAVTVAIGPTIADAEQHRPMHRPPASLDAWGAYQRGLWHLSRASADDNALAEKFFQRAIDLDATFAGGYKGLALARNNSGTVYQTRDLFEAMASAEELARQAVALDGADAEARARLGMTLWMRADYEGALAETGRALAISPNLAYAHGIRGSTLIFFGTAEGRARLYRDLRQTRPPRPEPCGSLEPRGVGPLFLPRIRRRYRDGKKGHPILPTPPDGLSLARRSAWPSWQDRGSEGRVGEGHLDRASVVRDVCPWTRDMVPTARPRPLARRPQKSRLGGLTIADLANGGAVYA